MSCPTHARRRVLLLVLAYWTLCTPPPPTGALVIVSRSMADAMLTLRTQQAWGIVQTRFQRMLRVPTAAAPADARPSLPHLLPTALLPTAPTFCGPTEWRGALHPDDVSYDSNSSRLVLTLSPAVWREGLMVYLYTDTRAPQCLGAWPNAAVAAFSKVCAWTPESASSGTFSSSATSARAGRPVLGYINLCSPTWDNMEELLTHELLHVVGFGAATFAKAFPYTFLRFASVGLLSKVEALASQHYGCSDIAHSTFKHGMPLDPEGSHMLGTLVGPDVMVPCMEDVPGKRAIITQFTGYVLDSLGFYSVDFGWVDFTWYGFRMGCRPQERPVLCEDIWARLLSSPTTTRASEAMVPKAEEWKCVAFCQEVSQHGSELVSDGVQQIAVPLTYTAAMQLSLLHEELLREEDYRHLKGAAAARRAGGDARATTSAWGQFWMVLLFILVFSTVCTVAACALWPACCSVLLCPEEPYVVFAILAACTPILLVVYADIFL